jgi:hypothetical protein
MMTPIEDKIEDEIDVIRVKHYEQTKSMTSDERISYIKKQIAPTLEQYGIHVVPSVDTLFPKNSA